MGFVSNLSKDSDLMSAEWIVPKKLYEALDLLRAALPGPSAFLTQRGQNHACAIFVPWATSGWGPCSSSVGYWPILLVRPNGLSIGR